MTKTHFHHRTWRELMKHKLAYTILVVGLVALVWLFIWAGQRLAVQRVVIMTLGIFYAAWGIVTHVSSKKVNTSLVLEYIVVSVLAVVSLLLLTI
jgi:hypothetical protein